MIKLPIGGPWVISMSVSSGIMIHFSRHFSPRGRLNAQSQNNGCLQQTNSKYTNHTINEPRREKMGLRTYANSKASGESVHPRSLAKAMLFAISFIKVYCLSKANSKASGETAWMRRLAWSFAVCICPKAHFLTTRLINNVICTCCTAFTERERETHCIYWVIDAVTFIWAASWENGPSDICEQQSFRRACVSAQSHQKLCCLFLHKQ